MYGASVPYLGDHGIVGGRDGASVGTQITDAAARMIGDEPLEAARRRPAGRGARVVAGGFGATQRMLGGAQAIGGAIHRVVGDALVSNLHHALVGKSVH